MVIWIDEDEYLTAPEAAEILGVKTQTLYAYVSRGLLRSYRQGIRRHRLYRRRDVEALVQLTPGDAPRPRRRGAPPGKDWAGGH